MTKENLNLPKTSFSMRANLPQKEPDIADFWDKIDLYKNIEIRAKEKKNLFYMMAHLMQMDTFIWVRH